MAMAEPVAAPTAAEAEWAYRQGQGGRAPPRQSEAAPRLSVDGFEGPLDFLLEMVRRHQLDLGPLSIVSLTDQLLAALAAGVGRVPLERRSDWVVMASQLVLLKAQLLCPASPAAAEAAEAKAVRRIGQLAELARMRAAAAWLAARPQLGRSVFGFGQPTPRAQPQAELYVAFLEATLAMLEGQERRGRHRQPTSRPRWSCGACRRRSNALRRCCASSRTGWHSNTACQASYPTSRVDRCGSAQPSPAPSSPGWNWPATGHSRSSRKCLSGWSC
jgi:hypothetical protein